MLITANIKRALVRGMRAILKITQRHVQMLTANKNLCLLLGGVVNTLSNTASSTLNVGSGLLKIK